MKTKAESMEELFLRSIYDYCQDHDVEATIKEFTPRLKVYKKQWRVKRKRELMTTNEKAMYWFLSWHHKKFGTGFGPWKPQHAKFLKEILKQIEKKLEENNQPTDETMMLEAFKLFMDRINDEWVLDNFNLSLVNSKFNQIYLKIKNKGKNTKTGKFNEASKERPWNKEI